MILVIVTAIIFLLSFIFSMLGLGGAMLYIPVLHWFGFDFKSVAIPTGLLLNGITVFSATISYLRSKMVDVKGALPLAITSFIGAPLGVYFTRLVRAFGNRRRFSLCAAAAVPGLSHQTGSRQQGRSSVCETG